MPYLFKLINKVYKMAQPRERKVIMHNAASLTVLQIIGFSLPIILIPYLFRKLGPEKFGLIAFAQAFVQYFMIITDYGFNITATKEISLSRKDQNKIKELFSSVMAVKMLLACACVLILAVVVSFIPKFKNDWLVYVYSFGTVIGSIIFPVWFFQGVERMRYITIINIIGGILYGSFIFISIHDPKDYLMVPLINSAVSLITGLLGQYIVLKRFGVSYYFPGIKNILLQLKASWDIFISIAAINAYTTTRIFLLGLLTNNQVTGFYSMAEKIANACQTFPLDSFSQALFPRLSHIFHKNKAKAFQIMHQMQHITVLISLIFLPAVFIVSSIIVRIVCGGDYPKTALALRLLLIAVFFVAANAFRIQFLLVCGKTRLYSKIHVIMALIGLPLLLILIKYYSYIGAALATVAIEAAIFVITYFTVKKLAF